MTSTRASVVIIGAGFFGLRLAIFLREQIGVHSVIVLEREPAAMQRASLVNQARVHNGYHYPRSILTAFRSRVNFPRFVEEYRPAIVDDFEHHYGISSQRSKVSATQFEQFCLRIGAEFAPASSEVRALVDPAMLDGLYTVREYAFDASTIRGLLLDRAAAVGGIEVRTGVVARAVRGDAEGPVVVTDDGEFAGERVFNATYSRLNEINRASHLPTFDLQQEIAEMAIVDLPERMRSSAFTIMDGPFFSLMPYPTRRAHTLSHVRYTPHRRWIDGRDGTPVPSIIDEVDRAKGASTFRRMQADVARYLPWFRDAVHIDSIYEAKTVPVKGGENDSRPILFRSDLGIDGYSCVLGGKLDNIYDVFDELEGLYG